MRKKTSGVGSHCGGSLFAGYLLRHHELRPPQTMKTAREPSCPNTSVGHPASSRARLLDSRQKRAGMTANSARRGGCLLLLCYSSTLLCYSSALLSHSSTLLCPSSASLRFSLTLLYSSSTLLCYSSALLSHSSTLLCPSSASLRFSLTLLYSSSTLLYSSSMLLYDCYQLLYGCYALRDECYRLRRDCYAFPDDSSKSRKVSSLSFRSHATRSAHSERNRSLSCSTSFRRTGEGWGEDLPYAATCAAPYRAVLNTSSN
jgi:hypothetical protein